MKNEMMMLGAVLVAALGNAGAAPLARPKVRVAGEIGAKFETCLRGNGSSSADGISGNCQSQKVEK